MNTRIVPTYVIKQRIPSVGEEVWDRVSPPYASREYALETCLRMQHSDPLSTFTVVTVNTCEWSA